VKSTDGFENNLLNFITIWL